VPALSDGGFDGLDFYLGSLNMNKSLLFVLTSATALMCLDANADESKAERAQEMKAKLVERFNAADANRDGRLTKLEAEGKMPRVVKNFEAMDVHKRGYVTVEQISDFAAQQIQRRRAAKMKESTE